MIVQYTTKSTKKNYIAQLKELSRTCKFGETANGADLTQQKVLEDN